MGSLAEEAAAASVRPRPTLCVLCNWYDAATPDDQADLIRLLDDPGVQAVDITAALIGRGLALNNTTVPRHRRRQCVAWEVRRDAR